MRILLITDSGIITERVPIMFLRRPALVDHRVIHHPAGVCPKLRAVIVCSRRTSESKTAALVQLIELHAADGFIGMYLRPEQNVRQFQIFFHQLLLIGSQDILFSHNAHRPSSCDSAEPSSSPRLVGRTYTRKNSRCAPTVRSDRRCPASNGMRFSSTESRFSRSGQRSGERGSFCFAVHCR